MALIDAVIAFLAMIAAFGDKLQEAEINPLFVLPQGSGVVAADGIAMLKTLAYSEASQKIGLPKVAMHPSHALCVAEIEHADSGDELMFRFSVITGRFLTRCGQGI